MEVTIAKSREPLTPAWFTDVMWSTLFRSVADMLLDIDVTGVLD